MVRRPANTNSNRSKRLKTTSVIHDPPRRCNTPHGTLENCEYVEAFLLKAWSLAGDSIRECVVTALLS